MTTRLILTALLSTALAACSQAESEPNSPKPAQEAAAMSEAKDIALQFTSITGEAMSPDMFEDKAVLVVNTASRCGFTNQYQGLQALWTDYKDKGLVVLGIPSGDFGNQELATEEEVKKFCEINYGVDFPLTEKTTVKGPAAHPFYAFASDTLGASAQPKWNFHKILVDRSGTPVKAFPSSVTPSDKELISAIEAVLEDQRT